MEENIKATLFQDNPTLSTAPDRVRSSVSLTLFWEFASALDSEFEIRVTNFPEMLRLCEEFGFANLTDFQQSKKANRVIGQVRETPRLSFRAEHRFRVNRHKF
jgi:hypothetical protein